MEDAEVLEKVRQLQEREGVKEGNEGKRRRSVVMARGKGEIRLGLGR